MKEYKIKYVVYDLDLVTVIHALNMWRHYLVGRKFTLITNHISLKYFFNQHELNAKQARWMDFLIKFSFDIKHNKEKEIKVADTLSQCLKQIFEDFVLQLETYSLENVKEKVLIDQKYDNTCKNLDAKVYLNRWNNYRIKKWFLKYEKYFTYEFKRKLNN